MMEVSKENPADAFMEIDLGSSAESFQKFLASQKELFHSQIDLLQKIVVTQCRLTGVNPLSQEMAAGSLSIKIGKRPRDLLNPKAVKYMQSVFSIKDTISKKESREISALCGVTVTQVREFFAGQRSRVRKLVRLSKEKVIRSIASKASQDECSTGSDPAMSIDQVPLNSVDPKAVEEVPSCSSQEEALPDIDNSDKTFLENIFNLMRKEETFSGQVKLMEWIIQIQNSSVLYWFLTKGGLMIITTWLSQAALEEQTTVLLVIFKVLCHLPLHKALPVHMSAILQTVNRLRFYRTSDISNRARVLLSRWSKLFVRSQALKKTPSMKSPNAGQKEIIQKQRMDEILCDESWQSAADIPEEILALTFEGSECPKKSEPSRTLKLLPASADEPSRRHIRSVSSPQTRERRKVLFVEQPGQRTGSRSPHVARAVPVMQGRPMSVDDIQKAKMRALFMQSKYGKIGSSSNDDHQQKMEDPMKPSASRRSILPSASSNTSVRLKIEEDSNSAVLASTISPSKLVDPIEPKSSLDHQESSQEKFRRDKISWQTPPEMRMNSLWRVGTGEKSKEVEVQIERIRREKGTFYHSNQDIPPSPKEPWDIEMDYDDTLTPEIPTEQPPDADVAQSLVSPIDKGKTSDTSAATAAATSKEYCPSVASTSNGCAAEPDLELLAVLLKNPQLVFALTSGQGGNLTGADTVRLLDMIKANGIGLPGISGMGGKTEEKVEVTSLPSPTPGSDHIMSGWRSEVGKDRFSQSVTAASETSSIPSMGRLPHGGPVQPQVPSQNFSSQQIPTGAIPVPQQLQAALQLLASQNITSSVLPEKQLPSVTLSLSQQSPTSLPLQQTPISEAVLPMKQFFLSPAPQQPESGRLGQMHNLKPATVSIVMNPPKERPPIALHPLPASLPTPPRPRLPLLPDPPPPVQPLHTTWPPNAAGFGKQASVSASRNVRQFPATNLHFQANQNNYNVFPRGLVPPTSYGPPNEFVGEPELEMWSPEGSPVRSPSYQSGWSFPEPRSGYGWNSRPDRLRQQNSSYRDRDRRHGRRWRERRH